MAPADDRRRVSSMLVLAVGVGIAVTAALSVRNVQASASAPNSPHAKVKSILGFIGPVKAKDSGRGMRFKIGVTVALSGGGSIYGTQQLKGAQLAAKQIKELGGPDFVIVPKDNRSGDAAAGVAAAKELGLAKVSMGLVNYVADLGAMLPGIAQYRMLTFDGGGGTSLFAQKKPYFWGSRAITPDDPYPGVVRYLKQKMPQVKKVSMVGWDLGPVNKIIEKDTRQQLAKAGIQLLGYEAVPIGGTDYASAIQHVRSQNPDLVFASVFGLDLANFMKQYATSGIGKPVVGFDYTDEAAAAAGGALDNYLFAYDAFDATHSANGWAKIFVDTYKAAYGKSPTEYGANYYEDVFAFWDLVRRVIARGGNPHDGAALQAALVRSPTFKSIYGGDATHAGVLAFNLKTHSVSRRPMGLFKFNAKTKTRTPLAWFDIGGRNYRPA